MWPYAGIQMKFNSTDFHKRCLSVQLVANKTWCVWRLQNVNYSRVILPLYAELWPPHSWDLITSEFDQFDYLVCLCLHWTIDSSPTTIRNSDDIRFDQFKIRPTRVTRSGWATAATAAVSTMVPANVGVDIDVSPKYRFDLLAKTFLAFGFQVVRLATRHCC